MQVRHDALRNLPRVGQAYPEILVHNQVAKIFGALLTDAGPWALRTNGNARVSFFKLLIYVPLQQRIGGKVSKDFAL